MSDRFPQVGRLSRGYARRQVDSYLARVEAALDSGRVTSRTTPAAIRRAAFDLVLHGYQPAAVDAALDELEQRALALEASTGGQVHEFELASEAGVLRDRASGPYGARFRRTSALRRGYDVDDVDDLLDTLGAPLRGEPGPGAHAVRVSVFRPQRGGYDEDAVDEYLDRVVELFLRQELLASNTLRWNEPTPQRAPREPAPREWFR